MNKRINLNAIKPIAFVMAMSFGSLGFAQAITPKDPVPSRPPVTAAGAQAETTRAWDMQHRASRIIGTNVRNMKGERLGDIEDIVLDRNGSVAYAVVGTGGFLGIGGRLHAVPWKSLRSAGKGESHLLIDIDRKRLEAAPGFDSDKWPNFSDDNWNRGNLKAFQAR